MTDRMTDEFFDDEVELEAAAEGPVKPRSGESAAQPSAEATADGSTSSGHEAPPFWMVLVITAIALLLGVIIGYLLGSASALNSISSMQQAAQEEQSAADDSAYALPEGHPDIEVETDGTAHVADGTE